MPAGPSIPIVTVGSVRLGGPDPVLICGPCVIEDEAATLRLARRLQHIAATAGLPLIFKASFDKANRTSGRSYRGPGLVEGLRILARVRSVTGLPLTTDLHELAQVAPVAEVVDLLQVPAFLCRQTDLIEACARSGRATSIKKGQFLAPLDMAQVVDKFRAAGGRDLMLIERGASFGYNNLVADLRSLPLMRGLGCPVVFDATHSVQMPGGAGDRSSGSGQLAPALARAALAVGCEGIFLETHADPARSPSDGPNMVPLKDLPRLLGELMALHRALGRPAPGR